MKFKRFEIIITELLSIYGKPIVKYTGCQKCYGRGFKYQVGDKEYEMEQFKLKLAKAMKKVKETLEIGPHIQCPSCENLALEHSAELEMEIHNKKFGKEEDGTTKIQG